MYRSGAEARLLGGAATGAPIDAEIARRQDKAPRSRSAHEIKQSPKDLASRTRGCEHAVVAARSVRPHFPSLLSRDRAYKRKKPLVLPFLGYGSLARRCEMCREQVEVGGP
jgi:hypothetical protein